MSIKVCQGSTLAHLSIEELRKMHDQKFQFAAQSYNGYVTSGVVTKKEWLTAGDKNVCEICKQNEAAGAIPLEENFPNGHLFPPANAYRRCVIQPVVE